MQDADQILAIADSFFAAVEAGDLDAVTAHYHPDARIWHSRDEADTNVAQNRELLRMFFARVANRRYEIVRRHVFDGGFVQEHVVHGHFTDGSVMRVPVCFLCHIDGDGRITRIAEYLDSSKSPLRGVVQHDAPA